MLYGIIWKNVRENRISRHIDCNLEIQIRTGYAYCVVNTKLCAVVD